MGASYSNWQPSGGQPGNFNWNEWFTTPRGGGARTRVEYSNLDEAFGGLGGFSDFFQTIFGGLGGTPRSDMGGRARVSQRAERLPAIEQPVQITFAEAYKGTERTLQVGERRMQVKIPPGADNGTKVRMAGVGSLSRTQGDIYLIVKVTPDPRFERKGNDLTTDVDLDLYTAVLGAGKSNHPRRAGCPDHPTRDTTRTDLPPGRSRDAASAQPANSWRPFCARSGVLTAQPYRGPARFIRKIGRLEVVLLGLNCC